MTCLVLFVSLFQQVPSWPSVFCQISVEIMDEQNPTQSEFDVKHQFMFQIEEVSLVCPRLSVGALVHPVGQVVAPPVSMGPWNQVLARCQVLTGTSSGG